MKTLQQTLNESLNEGSEFNDFKFQVKPNGDIKDSPISFFNYVKIKNLLSSNSPILKQYAAVRKYFKQYAAGVTGANRDAKFLVKETGECWKNKAEVKAAVSKNNINAYSKKGKKTDYGEIGAEQVVIDIDTVENLLKKYYNSSTYGYDIHGANGIK